MFNETGDSVALSRRHPGVDVAAWTQASHQAWRVIKGPGARGRGQGSRMSSPEEPRGASLPGGPVLQRLVIREHPRKALRHPAPVTSLLRVWDLFSKTEAEFEL